ncbi:MAG: hypothetical protein LBB50_04370, partial [Oscillospiraceae bacterium]|nr:hypothetical protein [Oscillospiraceae bacterium]
MITTALIQKLKQGNVSEDTQKTGQRVQALWHTASATQKQSICDVSGNARPTIYGIVKTGRISVKLLLVMSQFFHVDPLYLTGQVDSPGAHSEAEAEKLLSRLGYDKLLIEQENAVRHAQRETAKSKKTAAA